MLPALGKSADRTEGERQQSRGGASCENEHEISPCVSSETTIRNGRELHFIAKWAFLRPSTTIRTVRKLWRLRSGGVRRPVRGSVRRRCRRSRANTERAIRGAGARFPIASHAL